MGFFSAGKLYLWNISHNEILRKDRISSICLELKSYLRECLSYKFIFVSIMAKKFSCIYIIKKEIYIYILFNIWFRYLIFDSNVSNWFPGNRYCESNL